MTQPTIHDILLDALQKIREEHGLAVYRLDAEWSGTIDQPETVVMQIEFNGRAVK